MPNHLVGQTSPYLLQHAHNPVDWYPWGDEALQRARREQRPIFLSVGYAACHWCHVMEHESFENEELARTLNEHFVCIKVDREERPDIDQLYMQAVQMITGRGGWPMSVFLTPELEPFFGGTYWPPTSRQGMPGFDRVLQAVLEAWRDRRQQAMEQARQLTQRVRQLSDLSASKADRPALTHQLRIAAVADLERVFDHQWGGFGGAPKFPHPMDLRVILRQWRRSPQDAVLQMVTRTLDAMASGGIYDHLGGGFHRYSVDARWLVPHFEKMLYDNALLTMCYVEAWQATGREDYARVARETCEFVLRELTTAEGAFASTLDADSEGEEGKYYVWSLEELQRVLGPDAARTFAYVYDVTATGNFEGHSILNLGKTLTQCAHVLQRDEQELSQELAQSRARLLSARENRVRPGLDDKVLVSWNGLMIEALALAGAALREPRFTAAAARAAETLLTRLRRDDGGLYHTFREGRAHLNAYLDDYAALALGLTTLYEADFQHRWIGEAVRLSERMLRDFSDVGGGALFFTAADHEQLIARPKDIMDSSVPSGNSLAATLLCRLAKLTGRADFSAGAEGIFTAFAHMIEQSPTATGQLLIALDFHLGPTSELVLVGDPRSTDVQQLLADLQRRFVPNRVLSCAAETPPTELAALWNGKLPMEASNLPVPPRLFVCQDFTCQAPIDGKEAILAAWDQLEISGASPTHAGKPATGP